MFRKLLLTISASIAAFCPSTSPAEVNGKIDVGPAYVHIDVLQSGHTLHSMDMGAIRADMYYRFGKCFVIKPNILYAHGSKKDMAINGGFALGALYPATDRLTVTGLAGVTWGYLTSDYEDDFPVPDFPDVLVSLKINEKFRSTSPYLGIELSYKICEGLRLTGQYQYVWATTDTKIKTIARTLNDKSHSDGPNYGLMLEYDLNECWSVNIGGAYNISLSREKHGIRAGGVKLGVAWWF